MSQLSAGSYPIQSGMPDTGVLDDELAITQEEEVDSDGESAENQALLRQLQEWLQHERDRQAENRYQMALDGEYMDGHQWLEEDAKEIEARGQAPLTFNEIAVSIRWITGSEKRNRVDWRVLPRTADDAAGAEAKTAVLKYVSDVNNTPFNRSASFREAAISGLSWIEDNLSTDGNDDILYNGHQSWRTAYHDSYHLRMDAKDMRYYFRWRTLDKDVAKALFPGKHAAIDRACTGAMQADLDEQDDLWYLGELISDRNSKTGTTRTRLASTAMSSVSNRERVRVYECWYRVPTPTQVMRGGKYDGDEYDETDARMVEAIDSGESYTQPSVTMKMRVCFFVDDEILESGPSPFKHNDFPFTPIYCFRRQRDGLPYGFIRNMRDAQDDLNRRMSKSLFLLSVNQLVTEFGAFDENGEYTLQDAIDNASNPAGVFVMKDGSKRFEINRDYADQDKQLAHVGMDRQFLQSTGGVTDELLGRKTNATSGIAIEARQEQGSLATSDIFDNHRLAIRVSGQKALSNVERFYSMPKIVRVTGQSELPNWLSINEPEVDPLTGEVRFINDITASKADFIVDEQDYRASMRKAMFDSLNDMIGKVMQIAPQFGVSLLDLMVDLADFPGKEQMVERIKMLIAEFRGEAPKSPEQAAMEAEAAELEKRAVAAKIAKDESGANKADAEADQIRMTLPATAVAMDLQNVSQSQANAGIAPPTAAAPATMGVPEMGAIVPEMGTTTDPSMQLGQAPIGGQPPQVQPGAPVLTPSATSSGGVAQVAPDPTVAALSQAMAAAMQVITQAAQVSAAAAQTSAQVMEGLKAQAATMETVAATVESVAQMAQQSQATSQRAEQAAAASADTMAAALDAVSATVEKVADTASKASEHAQGARKDARDVAQAVAELKKPRTKTVEFVNAQGKKVRATIKG